MNEQLSKRETKPIATVDDKERLAQQIEIVEKELDLLDTEIKWREKSPEFQFLVTRALQRCIRIAIDSINTDPSDLVALSSKRGQFFENLELTKELLMFKNKRVKKMNWIMSLKQWMLSSTEKKGQ